MCNQFLCEDEIQTLPEKCHNLGENTQYIFHIEINSFLFVQKQDNRNVVGTGSKGESKYNLVNVQNVPEITTPEKNYD